MRFPWIFTPCLLGWALMGGEAIAQQIGPNALPDVPIPPASQARPATSMVSAQRARLYTSPVNLYPGRNSIIDFAATGEVITYIQLSDLSHIVYDTNAPIDSGAAQVVTLRLIQPLLFEGLTKSAVPNMVISTLDEQGNTYTYLFDLFQNSGRPSQTESNGIAIAPASEVRQTRLFNTVALRPNVLRTNQGEATLEDIEQGLAIAIELGYTPANDPVVADVQEAIALARNGTPLRTAADQLGLDMAVLTTLGEIGIENSILAPVESESAIPIDVEPLNYDDICPVAGCDFRPF